MSSFLTHALVGFLFGTALAFACGIAWLVADRNHDWSSPEATHYWRDWDEKAWAGVLRERMARERPDMEAWLRDHAEGVHGDLENVE